MEVSEQALLENLSNTMGKTRVLMQDLSTRSVELSNTVVPRNKPKPKKMP